MDRIVRTDEYVLIFFHRTKIFFYLRDAEDRIDREIINNREIFNNWKEDRLHEKRNRKSKRIVNTMKNFTVPLNF